MLSKSNLLFIDEVSQDGQTIRLNSCLAQTTVLGVIVDEVNLREILVSIKGMLGAHAYSIIELTAPMKMESKKLQLFFIV